MEDNTSLVKKAAVELGVDKPIMSYKVVGDRVELHLLGGSVVHWTARPAPGEDAGPDLPIPPYHRFTMRKLRLMAGLQEIRGRSKMNRAELIDALEETSD